MGGKPRMVSASKRFACWICMDSGFVQEWERELDHTEYCSFCWRGKLAKQEAE
jgi:hypothetical protein